MYEVEQKFRVNNLETIKAAFQELGASSEACELQRDRYFAHPTRDFVQTDEAFRLRQIGDKLFVTYKGPKISSETKTRREIELLISNSEDSLESFTQLLEALGFRPVADVVKRREQLSLLWRNRSFAIAFDEVEGAGTFVEMEAAADDTNLAAVQADLLAFAKTIGLRDPVRESYLEMVLRNH